MKIDKAADNDTVLIVFDSWYGNTQAIAEAVARGMGNKKKTHLVKVEQIKDIAVSDYTLIIVGTPVHGGRPSEKIHAWVKSIPAGSLKGVHIVVFDTRFAMKDHGLGLKLLMKTIGFAADKLASQLTKLGGELVLPVEGFIVQDKKGPLVKGELERAGMWGGEIAKVSGLHKEK